MYIKFMIEQNKNIYISTWLLSSVILVILMILVGGLTRLTDSGLSITEWNIISGILPPFSNIEWEKKFSLYKEIPEFFLLNSDMTLAQFKVIFWWEYIHRLLGRIIGLVFLIPLIYFSFKKDIKKKILINLYLIFILICFQGFIGWYMVQSGLSERTDVSHYRLSLHLSMAFIILIMLIWNYFIFSKIFKKSAKYSLKPILPISLTLLIFIQISLGAFVSGLDAGQIYQSWPLMNNSYYPDDSTYKQLFSSDFFNNPSLLQFVHRNLAYLILFLFIFIFYLVFFNEKLRHLRHITNLVFIALSIQIFLGILTILSGAQIFLASMHQIGSVFLIITSLALIYKNKKIN